MKYANNTFSTIISSINSVILGLSLTSFNFIKNKSESLYIDDSLISFELLSSFAVSNIFLGGLLFNIFNRIKKEKTLIIFSTICNLLGYFAISVYPSLYVIFFARIIIGIGCGCTCYVVPQYIYTLAPKETQGLWTSLHPINLNLGILLGQSLIPFNTIDSWYIPYRCIVVVLFFLTFVQIFIVDTNKDGEELTSISELIKNKRSFKSVVIVCILHISQHLSGIDYVSIYLPNILNSEYMKILSIYFLTIPSVILSSILLNRYGRKYLYVISAGILCISSGVLVHKKIIGLIVFLLGYNIGISNVPWIIPNEVTPDKYVAPITKLGIISNWGSAYFLLIIFKKVHGVFNDNSYYMYTSLMLVMVLFTIFYVPETKGNKEFL